MANASIVNGTITADKFVTRGDANKLVAADGSLINLSSLGGSSSGGSSTSSIYTFDGGADFNLYPFEAKTHLNYLV